MTKTLIVLFSLIALSFNALAQGQGNGQWRAASGTALHFESEGIEHSVQPTANGMIRRSTDIVQLSGDLEGQALFQAVSVFDFAAGTLVNTGQQVFSGTVLGSEPVVLHDDDFRFDIDLVTGATTGEIYLINRVSGPNIRCVLRMEGTGRTPEGYNESVYWGECRVK